MSLDTTKIVLDPEEANFNADRRLIAGRLIRGRSGRSVTLRTTPSTPTPVIKPANVSHLLAAAYWVIARIDAGELRDLADAARRFGITRARMTQIMDLMLLAPEIQEQVLSMHGVGGRCGISERCLRALAKTRGWPEQRSMWQEIHPHGQIDCSAT
jgi:hypothetical protein